MSEQFIRFEVADSVGKIILHRPNVLNSFNRAMSKQMHEAIAKCASDKNIRAVFLTGEGRAFCAGQDLQEAIDPQGPDIEKIVLEHYNPIILGFRNMEKPVVCAVNGVAAGAGANVALACDIVIAGASAVFSQAFSRIGLIPDSGGTFILPRLVGWGRTPALMMLAEKVTAEQAVQIGMIYKAVPDDKLQEEGYGIAKLLATLPTIGLGLTKQLLNASFNNSLEEQLAMEAKMQVIAAKSNDHLEGVRAFLEKRKPAFKGN